MSPTLFAHLAETAKTLDQRCKHVSAFVTHRLRAATALRSLKMVEKSFYPAVLLGLHIFFLSLALAQHVGIIFHLLVKIFLFVLACAFFKVWKYVSTFLAKISDRS